MEKILIYIHGQGGNAGESEHYKALFPGCKVVGLDYKSQTPWEAKTELPRLFDEAAPHSSKVVLIANSIGAFFTMNARINGKIKKAYFISPVVDMEKLITDMMTWAGVTEDEVETDHKDNLVEGEVKHDLPCSVLHVKDGVVEIAGSQHHTYGSAQSSAVLVDVFPDNIVVWHLNDVGQSAQPADVFLFLERGILVGRFALLVES